MLEFTIRKILAYIYRFAMVSTNTSKSFITVNVADYFPSYCDIHVTIHSLVTNHTW